MTATTPKCKKCHRTAVQHRGDVCPRCAKKNRSGSSSGGHFGGAASVMARCPAARCPIIAVNGSGTIVTTSDILRLRGKSLSTATGPEFHLASDLALGWNQFLSQQPITVALG